MFNKLTVGKKISLGFGLILFLAVILGSVAIYEMRGIRNLSNSLALDYAPEIEIVTSLERNSRRVMYEMRAYGFTEESKFYELAIPLRARLAERVKSADALAEKSKVLKALSGALKLFNTDIAEYDELMASTKEHIEQLDILRHAMDKSAGEFFEAGTSYLAGQNRQAKKELNDSTITVAQRKDRLEKIELIMKIMNVGNQIRVKNFKNQTLRDPKAYKLAIKDFDQIDSMGKRVMRLTHKQADQNELRQLLAAKDTYKSKMIEFLEEWIDLQKLGVQRNNVGQEVIKKAEDVSKVGIGRTKEVAKIAMDVSDRANTIMILGLIITVFLGAILSWILVRGITGPIRNIAASLRDSSIQVSSASAQLSEAGQELSSSSNQQAASIEETSASLEEMTGMVNNNVEGAKKCVEISRKVSDFSQKGNVSMNELVESMVKILESNNKIQQLVNVIGEIGEKTAIIDEIVFQTKLLSFNASVEAERAGEHGRGFAVVAQEVGNLAQMSGSAATEISAIVKESIKSAEEITRENKQKVEEGNEVVKSSAEILKDITEESQVLLTNVSRILEASKEQSLGIEQINKAVIQLDRATQENAATAEETASSSEELSAQAESLDDMVGELTKILNGCDSYNSDVTVRKPSLAQRNAVDFLHSKTIEVKELEAPAKVQDEDNWDSI